MNERIKELIEQVEKWIKTTNFEGMPEDDMTYEEIFNKKFAELIIRECANIDFRFKVGMTTDQESDTSRVILDHFGVK